MKTKFLNLEVPTTLEEFAKLINNNHDWSVDFNEIISLNNWKDLTGDNPYDICKDEKGRLLSFDDSGTVAKIYG